MDRAVSNRARLDPFTGHSGYKYMSFLLFSRTLSTFIYHLLYRLVEVLILAIVSYYFEIFDLLVLDYFRVQHGEDVILLGTISSFRTYRLIRKVVLVVVPSVETLPPCRLLVSSSLIYFSVNAGSNLTQSQTSTRANSLEYSSRWIRDRISRTRRGYSINDPKLPVTDYWRSIWIRLMAVRDG
jgi:hypothetical protein